MNKEQQQIIDEAYKKYQLETWGECDKKWLMELDGMNTRTGEKCKVHRQLAKEEFVNKCKTDNEFSEKWGLKIEERELSFEERWDISKKYGYRTGDAEIPSPDSIYLGVNERQELESLWNDPVIGTNLPTKLITVTYKDKTIESYES